MAKVRGEAATTMRRLLREPLLHFLVLAAVLFGIYGLARDADTTPASSKEIRLMPDELAQLIMVFQSQWRRQPTPEEFNRLIENRVEQEILYREALAMGLDKDDEIVKRRMAQKMKFLAEDVATAREPTTDDLKNWFEKNSAKFSQPPRLSFRHIYFSPDRRGAQAREDAAHALLKLAGKAQDAKLADSLADRFMFQEYYRDRAQEYLGKEFGPQFALAVAELAPGSWQGPIESGFGWHLVFVDTVIPGRVPAFEEVEPDVKTAWLAEHKAKAWEKAYSDMRAKYTVLLPVPSENASADEPGAGEAFAKEVQ